MTDPQIGMLMLGLFIFIIMLGFPIAFTLIAMGVGFGYYAYYTPGQEFFANRVFTLLVQKTFEVTSSDTLVAIPLFLFMGYLIERANVLDRLFYSLQLSMKNVPGALAVATLLTCAMFATATGIVGAVVTLMGLLALPAMLRAGYDVKLSAGVVCAGGCLGILIPPSILLIVYAATAGVSAVKLYAAAFFPGFLLAGLYMVYVIVRAIINPALAPKLPPEETNVPYSKVLWALATSFLPLALLIVSVLGAILMGLATPSEAAGAGALMAIVLAAAYRSLNFRMLQESVYLTARATAMVCYLFIGSWTFSSVFAILGGDVRELLHLVGERARPVAVRDHSRSAVPQARRKCVHQACAGAPHACRDACHGVVETARVRVSVVAREHLVAAVTGERHRHMLPGES